MKILTTFLILGLTFSLSAQIKLSGTIIDSRTGDGIEAANAFIAYSNIGTMTDANGHFSMMVPLGKSELVISHIAYKTFVRKLSYIKAGEKSQTIRMVSNSVNLEEVTVSAKSGKKWRKNLKKFEKAFLGTTQNADHCKIINPTVLNFENQSGKLIATATDFIEIENRGTGYQLFFLLEKFEADGPQVTYAGKPFFRELEASDDKEAEQWAKRRKTTFKGSPTHFYQALLKNNLEEEGFDLYTASLQSNKDFLVTGQPQLNQLLKPGANPGEKLLDFKDFLKIEYTREEDDISINYTRIGSAAKQLGHKEQSEVNEQERRNKDFENHQVSYLFARKANVPIDTSGYLLRPELIVEYGYWNHERVADLLPRNYLTGRFISKIDLDTFPSLLGFEMKNLRISYDEIKHGGPPKDGIPSIDHPKFITPESAEFLSDHEYVLGITIGDEAKAYPLSILDKHEIVNDWFGKEPIVVTYCPLCGSGAAFNARIDGQRRVFGVSGLLYNSDVLLYDRETESLWSQIMGEAISGAGAGTKLKSIPLVQTTWKAWRNAHPNTLVLSTDTGFDRDYQKKSYESYRNSGQLMFPVSRENRQFKNKEVVIGIEIDGKFKAYPFSKLAKKGKNVADTFNGQKLKILFDEENQSAKIFNAAGEQLPAMTLYWFAWYAFHPETEVFE